MIAVNIYILLEVQVLILLIYSTRFFTKAARRWQDLDTFWENVYTILFLVGLILSAAQFTKIAKYVLEV